MFTLTAPIAESVKQRSVVSVSIYIILSTCLSPVPSSFPSLFYNINAVIGAYAPNDQVRTRPAYASALLYECRYICLFPQSISQSVKSIPSINQKHQNLLILQCIAQCYHHYHHYYTQQMAKMHQTTITSLSNHKQA